MDYGAAPWRARSRTTSWRLVFEACRIFVVVVASLQGPAVIVFACASQWKWRRTRHKAELEFGLCEKRKDGSDSSGRHKSSHTVLGLLRTNYYEVIFIQILLGRTWVFALSTRCCHCIKINPKGWFLLFKLGGRRIISFTCYRQCA